MKLVFADTHYWVAISLPSDTWHEPAKKAKLDLGKTLLMTTDEVLSEFLGHLSPYGKELRIGATKIVRVILDNPNIKVVPQTRESFLRAIDLYQSRPDKEYSLVDCSSMMTMKEHGIQEVLTNDHHFEQEGYSVLIRK